MRPRTQEVVKAFSIRRRRQARPRSPYTYRQASHHEGDGILRRIVPTGLAIALCLSTLFAQNSKRSASQPTVSSDPPELTGPPKVPPSPPSAAIRRFFESGRLQGADPKKPETLAPAIRAVSELLAQEPSADFYFLRASLRCQAGADADSVLADLALSFSTPSLAVGPMYKTKRERFALKAKIEHRQGHVEAALHDLDLAIAEDYDSAPQVFNDGEVQPSRTSKPCAWTQTDLEAMARQRPLDHRPPLYLGLYLTQFATFGKTPDFAPILADFERAAALNPSCPLPHFYIGEAYLTGRLGGFLSTASAKCVDFIEPRTADCLAWDELRRTGVRAVTAALARDPQFAPGYASRAGALFSLKEYRQAIRDYDRAIELHATAALYNDRGLVKVQLEDYSGAIADFGASIRLGCEEYCGSFENRAVAYMKMHDYPRAVADYTTQIRRVLSNAVILMRIDQFRRVYPEYDAVADLELAERLRVLFFPQMARDAFKQSFLVDAKALPISGLLPELYLQRGDAYAKLGHVKQANRDYDRVSKAFPEWAKTAFVEVNGKRVRVSQ
jgi:tetratricopeptide (TPR) repeat protein